MRNCNFQQIYGVIIVSQSLILIQNSRLRAAGSHWPTLIEIVERERARRG